MIFELKVARFAASLEFLHFYSAEDNGSSRGGEGGESGGEGKKGGDSMLSREKKNCV